MSAPFQKHIIKDMIAAIANTKLKEIKQIYVCKIVSYDKTAPDTPHLTHNFAHMRET